MRGCEGVRVFWLSTGAQGLTAPHTMGRGEENRVFAAREKLFSRRFTCSNASCTRTGTWSRGARSARERARARFRILGRWYLWGRWCLWLLWFLCTRPTGAASGPCRSSRWFRVSLKKTPTGGGRAGRKRAARGGQRMGQTPWTARTVSRCQGVRVPGCQNARVSGCEGAKVPRCEGAKVRRCQGAKVSRCEGAKVSGCESAKV